MGLNPRGRGRGMKTRRGGGMSGPCPMFRGPPGMYGPPPPMGFPPGPPPFGPPYFGGRGGSNFGPRRPSGYGKFPRKTFKGRNQQRYNAQVVVCDIDLTKPWVTDDIKAEESKKQACLETWRKSKDDTDWSKYKEQKQIVQDMYDKAKAEYLANKPEEAGLHNTYTKYGYYCNVCDRSFNDEKFYYIHEMEHETCGIDGCTYTAHPKLVASHVEMQHDTGLYDLIGRLDTPDAIARWKEERKKNYPTKKIIEEKKLVEEEKKKKREEIKELKQRTRKSNSDCTKEKKFTKTKNNEKRSLKDKSNLKTLKRETEDEMTVFEALEEENSSRGSVPPFRGIMSLYADEKSIKEEEENLNFSDDEWEESNNTKTETETKSTLSNSLGMLALCYDSDECEEDVEPEIKTEKDDDEAPEEVKTVCVKEELTVDVENVDKNRTNEMKKKRGRHKRNRTESLDKENGVEQDIVHSKKRRSLNLYESLLSEDVRHEVNVILQCIRYVVDHNFFLNSS